jgi:transcriptional regulator with XRE-family HTH domain
MESKESFARFIKEKRLAQNLTQEGLAEKLFVTPTTVSKWERGVTYPDITLIAQICKALEITEREFLRACDDSEGRGLALEARKYRAVRRTYFVAVNALFAVALPVCFIVNLAAEGALTWFFIVLCALALGYSVVLLPALLKTRKALYSAESATGALLALLPACKAFGNPDFSLWAAYAITAFCLIFAWGILLICLLKIPGTKKTAAILLGIGLFTIISNHVIGWLLGVPNATDLPYLTESIGAGLAFAGFVFLFWRTRPKA